jgi:hypothetical protein
LTLIAALHLAAVAGEDFGGGEVFGDAIDGEETRGTGADDDILVIANYICLFHVEHSILA